MRATHYAHIAAWYAFKLNRLRSRYESYLLASDDTDTL